MNHYRSWSDLRKQLKGMLCPALASRMDYHLSRWHQVHNAYGAATVLLDGKPLVQFTWDMGYRQEADVHARWQETQGAADYDALYAACRPAWEADCILSDMDFLAAALAFRDMPIAAALQSENSIIQMFAILDRRVGKRTLMRLASAETAQKRPEWLQQFYSLRYSCAGMLDSSTEM